MQQNVFILRGNLGADPELRYTGTGKAVCQVSLAYNAPKKEGKAPAPPKWFYITAWGGIAENMSELRKGNCITVMGRLSVETWNDKTTGKERSKMALVAEGVIVHKKDEDNAGNRTENTKKESKPSSSDGPPPDDDDDRIPF